MSRREGHGPQAGPVDPVAEAHGEDGDAVGLRRLRCVQSQAGRAGVGRRIRRGYTGCVRFEWDPDKAARYDAKHGVTFAEAASVFTDPLAALFDDEWRSGAEPREIIVGQSDAGRVLLVCFTERRHDTVRIISAQPVTKRERDEYEQNIPG